MSTAPASVDGEAGAVVYFPWQPAQEKEGTAVDINALNGPKMTEGQIQTYLARLGIREEVPRTLEGLARIQLAHKIAVPFENLDIVAGRPLSLDLNHLYDKIVVRRQGGVCAELNTLYNWLLYSLGFRVVSYNARMLLQAGWVVAAFLIPQISFFAGALPILFPHVVIYYLQFTGKLMPKDSANPDTSEPS